MNQYVDLLSKCVCIDDKKCFDNFCHFQIYTKEKKEKFIISKGYSVLLLIPCDDF